MSTKTRTPVLIFTKQVPKTPQPLHIVSLHSSFTKKHDLHQFFPLLKFFNDQILFIWHFSKGLFHRKRKNFSGLVKICFFSFTFVFLCKFNRVRDPITMQMFKALMKYFYLIVIAISWPSCVKEKKN